MIGAYSMQKILVSILILVSLASYADERKALKLLEKKDYEKLVEYLDKDIEKDSLNPGSYYIYSLLYNDTVFIGNNLDTSYYYILKARKLYPPSDEKEIEKLNKVLINDSSLTSQKEKLDLLAYERAKNEHTLDSYNFYIEQFSQSIYKTDAIMDRNALAFEYVKKEHTYEAYEKFMLNYPGSIEFEQAKEQYQILLFEAQTEEGTLKSYRAFLKSNPNSPFRNDAIREIYQISTCSNSEESYLQFIKDFPESFLVQKAIDRLYHNYRESGAKDFSYNYNFLDLNDSIKNVDFYDDQFVIPVLENNKYGFMNSDGELIIPYTFDDVDEVYLCGNISDDYFRVRIDGTQMVASKDGKIIYQNPYNDVQELVSGTLKILNRGKYGLIFKTGEEIFGVKFDEIEKLDGQLIKARQGNTWFLYSLNGLQLLPEGVEEISREGEFLMIKNDGLWAITNKEYIFSSYIEGSIELNFTYDDYELIEPTQVLCFKGETEGVLDNRLEYQLALDIQNIYTLPEGWLIKKDTIYHLYDDAFVKISGTGGLTDVIYKGKWLTGRSGDKWILYHNFTPFPDVFAYDSISILSNNFVFAIEEEVPILIFSNYQKIPLNKHKNLRILKSPVIKDQNETIIEFIEILYDRNRNETYDINGKLVLKGSNLNLQLLGEEYFKKSYRGKVGLTDTAGQELLKPQFQGIANYDNGFVSVLNYKKFGIYNKRLGIYLKPAYDRLLKPYNSEYLIAYKSGGYGLINFKGESITDFSYDEIVYWNDSSILVKMEDIWNITELQTGEILLDGIKDFDFLNEEEEKIMLFRKEEQFGIVSSTEGIIISPTFNDILNIGNEETPIYFTEKYISEAEFYIVIYYNSKGEIIRKQVFTDEEYDMIYCN
jgi:hypothetical protein